MSRSTRCPCCRGRFLTRAATAVLALAAITGSGGFAGPDRAAAPAAAQPRPPSPFEWPVAIGSGPPDGSVWVGIGTDIGMAGGLERYTPRLRAAAGWGLHGWPTGLSIGPGSGDVFVDELARQDPSNLRDRVLTRFHRDGRHLGSWPVPASQFEFDAGRVAGGDGVFILYEASSPPERSQVLVLDALGREVRTWELSAPLGVQGPTAIAADPSGDVWVAFMYSSFTGIIRRYTADGQLRAELAYAALPEAMDVDAAGRLYVAGNFDLPGGQVTRFNPDGARDLDCSIADAIVVDIAAGPDAGFYLLVRPNGARDPLDDRELWRYDASCRLIDRQIAFGPIQGARQPPTATPGTVEPTPVEPSPSAVGPTAAPPSPTLTPPGRTVFLPLVESGLAMTELVQPRTFQVISEAIAPVDRPAASVRRRFTRLR